MFNWLKSKKQTTLDFSALGVDLHSHLIPGIDDGAKSLENSIQLIRKLMDMGFRKIITTPHIMADYYRNTPEIIMRGLDTVREELNRQQIDVQIDAAAEYYFDESFENKLKNGNLLTIANGFLLFELSYINYPANLFEVIEKILDKGYKPLLAHPERYPYLFGSLDNYRKLKDSGCYFQINILSFTGYYGKQSQGIAEDLADYMMTDFIATDLHHNRHAAALKQSLAEPYIKKLLTEGHLLNELLQPDYSS